MLRPVVLNGWVAMLSKYWGNLLIKRLKIIDLRLQPCLIPTSIGKNCKDTLLKSAVKSIKSGACQWCLICNYVIWSHCIMIHVSSCFANYKTCWEGSLVGGCSTCASQTLEMPSCRDTMNGRCIRSCMWWMYWPLLSSQWMYHSAVCQRYQIAWEKKEWAPQHLVSSHWGSCCTHTLCVQSTFLVDWQSLTKDSMVQQPPVASN